MTEDEIFEQALAISDSGSRARFIVDSCGENAEQASFIARLVASHFSSSQFMARPAGGLAKPMDDGDPLLAATNARAPTETAGDRIGPFELIDEIGRGGMAIVYRAHQDGPLRRDVALKIIKPGLETEPIIARMQVERQALAMMDHPGIAKVFDAGITQLGRPYYVMELVDGMPITKFCETNHTARRRRLELMLQASEAVDHAHRRGIIHRDIKPSNILVTQHEGQETSKVIDFGIAKVVSEEADGPLTHLGQIVGTPQYMSPEQAAPGHTEIDVRTDVYSLGAVLYELITGQPPITPGTLVETLHRIATDEPLAPSRIDRSVDADLDTICLSCLQKEPSQRYSSAREFAEDLRRFLENRPIDARPVGRAVRLWKWARRSPIAASLTGATALALVAMIGLWAALTWQLKTQRESAIAEHDEAEFQAYAANIAAADGAIRMYDVTDARTRLDLAPAGKRNWEWFQLQRRLDSSSLTFVGHRAYVERIKVLPKRGWLVSTSWDQTVRIWDLQDGRELNKFQLPAPAWSLDVSRDEELIAVGDWDHTVRVWNTASGELLARFRGPTQRVPAVAFAPDGSQLLASFWAFEPDEPASDNVLIIVDLKTQQVVDRWPQRAPVEAVIFAPDGQMVATVDQHGTQLWRWESREKIRALPGNLLAFSPSGKRFASAAGGNAVEVSSLDSVAPVVRLHGHTGSIFDARFSSDGQRIVTGSRDKTVRLWDTASGRELAAYLGHQWAVTSVAFDRDDERILSACWDQTIKAWEVEGEQTLPTIRAHALAVTDVKLTEDGSRMATASEDRSVKLWDYASRRLLRTFHGHDRPVQAIAFSPDATQLASASWDHTLKLWDVNSSQPRLTLHGHTDLVLGVAFHPAGHWLVSSSRDNTLRVWDVETGEELALLTGHDDHAHSVVFSPDAKYFASCGHRSVKLWDSVTRKELASFQRTILQEDYSLAFEPTCGLLVAGFDSRSVRFWDVERKATVGTVVAHSDEILSICFSPDGSRMVSTSTDGSVKIWDVPHRQPLNILHGYSGQVTRIAFTPDGRELVGGTDDGRIVFWEGPEQEP